MRQSRTILKEIYYEGQELEKKRSIGKTVKFCLEELESKTFRYKNPKSVGSLERSGSHQTFNQSKVATPITDCSLYEHPGRDRTTLVKSLPLKTPTIV